MREIHIHDDLETVGIGKLLAESNVRKGETVIVWGQKTPIICTLLEAGAVMSMPLSLAKRLGRINHGEG
ncbi:hypothetical protein A2872_02490 [Candidatus Gottesmanbacteria bacterium RIFCSPHIGHO2_01_FULL_42_12]|uniref:Uncharacterized protein n=1 Tax=Candidatus Gottesmanbacteria bacterium RIFCSPHIGHO2_01_FULL_42_12 TaxID=1798377 RepID=A0A1F5Z5J6_9BACT|nr:MAG: hypothetical protein A2872_02490 [Candidatus Gottesmanbacteria bacterium RIFCSPHIGHO2_01_FULL_42_12]